MLDNTFTWVAGLVFGKDTEKTTPLPYSATSTAAAANQIPRSTGSDVEDDAEWVFLDASGQIIASASKPEPPSDVVGKVTTVRKMTRKERKEAFRVKHSSKALTEADRGREILAALKDKELKASKYRKMACR